MRVVPVLAIALTLRIHRMTKKNVAWGLCLFVAVACCGCASNLQDFDAWVKVKPLGYEVAEAGIHIVNKQTFLEEVGNAEISGGSDFGSYVPDDRGLP